MEEGGDGPAQQPDSAPALAGSRAHGEAPTDPGAFRARHIVTVTRFAAASSADIGELVPLEGPAELGLFDAIVLTIAGATQSDSAVSLDHPTSTCVLIANGPNGRSPRAFTPVYSAGFLIVDELCR